MITLPKILKEYFNSFHMLFLLKILYRKKNLNHTKPAQMFIVSHEKLN